MKDHEYERQMKEKTDRINRLKDARRKYSKQKLKSKTRTDGSETGTSQDSNQKPLKLKRKVNEYDDSQFTKYHT